MCEATRDAGQCVGTSDAVRPASSFPEPASLRSSPSSDRRTRLGGGGREASLRLPTGAPAHPRGLSEDPPARRSSAPPDLALAGRALPLGPLGLSSLNGGRGALAPASPEAWAGPFQGPEFPSCFQRTGQGGRGAAGTHLPDRPRDSREGRVLKGLTGRQSQGTPTVRALGTAGARRLLSGWNGSWGLWAGPSQQRPSVAPLSAQLCHMPRAGAHLS